MQLLSYIYSFIHFTYKYSILHCLISSVFLHWCIIKVFSKLIPQEPRWPKQCSHWATAAQCHLMPESTRQVKSLTCLIHVTQSDLQTTTNKSSVETVPSDTHQDIHKRKQNKRSYCRHGWNVDIALTEVCSVQICREVGT